MFKIARTRDVKFPDDLGCLKVAALATVENLELESRLNPGLWTR
jgi:hypothetical protein